MLLISNRLFSIYCVLYEDGQVGRNMSQYAGNSVNSKNLVVTDGLLQYSFVTLVFNGCGRKH
jgi:hypothetical protein